ncbi:MAG: hypothetical protein ACRETN_13120 [Nevskiales bacterium]
MNTFKFSRLMLGAVLSGLAVSAAAEAAGPRDQYGRLTVTVSADAAKDTGPKCMEFRRVGPPNKGAYLNEYAWVNACLRAQSDASFGLYARRGPPFMWFGVKY